MKNSEILAKLDARYKRLAESPWALDREQKSAIYRTLGALDNPNSHYVNLSTAERATIRADWTALVEPMNRAPKSRKRKSTKQSEIPADVLDFFCDAECLPNRPRATNDYKKGLRRMSWKKARTCRSVELNPPHQIYWLIFDCDHQSYSHWKDAGLPPPSFITINTYNNHHHVVYRLKAPVCRSSSARQKPLDYLRAVESGIRTALDADPHYVGR